MTSLRLSLLPVASVCVLLSACAGGPAGTGTAGSSGGGTGGATGAAGASGSSGAAGTGGTSGSAGVGGSIAGNGAAGTGGSGIAGTTGSAGQGGSAGTTGTAGRGGTGGGTAGVTGSAGQGGSAGAAGSAGRGGTGGGQGGSAGAGGRGGATGSAGTGGGTGTAPFFTDNFESGTAGMQPAGWDNFIAYVAKGQNPNGTTLALVDTTRAHNGTKSVHFHGGSSPAQLARTLPTGTNKLYVRAWIWQTRTLGSMNASENHETLLGIRKNTNGADNEVRFGEVKGSIGTNEVPSDDFAPKLTQPGTATVAANRWACFEVAFLADQAQHTLTAWVDGTQVHAITSTPAQWEHMQLPANWMDGKFVQFIMGWQSFSGIDTDLWIDDVALGTERIGCN